ncbi:thioredoxin-like isoform X1 [Orbicella faveolata]|uniref:thioredoxin-like isoform X1 n=1 Tax=Orbicella faveolata TaxID=48498 RepID=UPI0009E61BA4|nr:thioredoxin-like isoform X1 [Orbicella faveolata]XP_020631685.1 thioredoxin-like isoform X1 [Orbicella faveolata]XP_020631686.1 thioredoxin-like isoform X1 [Orbicella faveolata]XP_020631687.1 thioredoxin-like isoform X1 [Orbicella faveolata]
MEEITNRQEYDQFIRSPDNKDKLIIIDFYAEWCGPCRKIKPFLRKLKEKYPEVIFAKVDVDDAELLAEEEKVEVMPTFFFIKNGDKLHVLSGSNEQDLEEKIKEFK